MPKRWCADCKCLYDIDSAPGLRCPACQAAATARRNARLPGPARGYDARHRAVRQQLIAQWTPGDPCALCGKATLDSTRLDLAHNEDRTGYKGLAHAACNRATNRRR